MPTNQLIDVNKLCKTSALEGKVQSGAAAQFGKGVAKAAPAAGKVAPKGGAPKAGAPKAAAPPAPRIEVCVPWIEGNGVCSHGAA